MNLFKIGKALNASIQIKNLQWLFEGANLTLFFYLQTNKLF